MPRTSKPKAAIQPDASSAPEQSATPATGKVEASRVASIMETSAGIIEDLKKATDAGKGTRGDAQAIRWMEDAQSRIRLAHTWLNRRDAEAN